MQLKLDCMSICFSIPGFTSDGEFNSLRTKGIKRALSVIELIKNSRNEARRMSPNTITCFLKLDSQGRCFLCLIDDCIFFVYDDCIFFS